MPLLILILTIIQTFFPLSNTFASNARLALNWLKIKEMLRNTLSLNFCYMKIIHILYPRYHQKIVGHTLTYKQNNKCVCIHEIIRLKIMKMKMKMKNRSHRYRINSSVLWQKGESQNGGNKNTKHAKFSEKTTFFTPIRTGTCAYQEVKNVRF